MQEFFEAAHTGWRWAVLALLLWGGITGLVLARRGQQGRGGVYAWAARALDIQILLGILLWITSQAWDGGETYATWIHPFIMLGAAGLLHLGLKRAEQIAPPRSHKLAGITQLLALAVILAAIPW